MRNNKLLTFFSFLNKDNNCLLMRIVTLNFVKQEFIILSNVYNLNDRTGENMPINLIKVRIKFALFLRVQ